MATPAKKLADPARLFRMAKHSSHILDMARKGAEHKYEELKTEIAVLVKNFPHLVGQARTTISRGAATLSKRGRAAVAAVTDVAAPRKRRKMSAKARKAIGDAQRRRWAEKKSGKK